MPTPAVGAATRALAAGVLFSLALWPVPLLDGLTYEYAVLTALAAFAAAAWLGSLEARAVSERYRLRWKLLDPGPLERLESGVRRAMSRTALAVAVAALVPAVHGLTLGCAVERGLPIYLLTTLPALVLGAATGAFARAVAPDSRARRALVTIGLVAASVALTLREVLLGPLAIFHNLVIGQVAATGYLGFDDAVRITADQVLHRTVTLVLAALLLALALARAAAAAARRAAVDGESLSGADRAEAERIAVLLHDQARLARRRALLPAALLLVMAAIGDPFGLGDGRSRVERSLRGRIEGGGVTLRFREGSRAAALGPVLLEDARWALGRVRRDLGMDPDPALDEAASVTIYIHDGAAEQQRLTGASGYLFAKPWLGELHTRLDPDSELVALRHELAHVVAARFGLPGLGISARYGLIEGLAEAVGGDYAARPWQHEPSAAALATGRLPPAAAALGTLSFATRDAEVSYLAAASFTGWLLREHGPERLRAVYARGNFEAVYGERLAVLDTHWRKFLLTVPTDAIMLAWAERAFDVSRNPPFFRRNCARLGRREGSSFAGEGAAERCDEPAAGNGSAVLPGRAARLEAERSRLDAAAARGSLAERERVLVDLATHLAREARLEEAAAALGRRADLARIAGRVAPIATVAAQDPGLVPLALAALGKLDPHGLDAFAPPSAPVDGEAAELVLLLASLARRDPADRLRERTREVGGCGAWSGVGGLATAESRALLRAARILRIDGDRQAALAAARNALSIADADADSRADAALAIDRLTFAGGQSHLNHPKSR